MSLEVDDENHENKMTCFRRDFGVKDPRHSETISDENCDLYRSTRHNVSTDGQHRRFASPFHPSRQLYLPETVQKPARRNGSS